MEQIIISTRYTINNHAFHIKFIWSLECIIYKCKQVCNANGQMFELWVLTEPHCMNCISRPTTHWLGKQTSRRQPTSHICLNNRHTSALAPWAAVRHWTTYTTLKGHPWYHSSSLFLLNQWLLWYIWGSKSNANQSREEAGNALLTQTKKSAWQASNNNNNTKLFQIRSKQSI